MNKCNSASFRGLPAEILYEVFKYVRKDEDIISVLGAFRTTHGNSLVEQVARDRRFYFSSKYRFENFYLSAGGLEVIHRSDMNTFANWDHGYNGDSLKYIFAHGTCKWEEIPCGVQLDLCILMFTSSRIEVVEFFLNEMPHAIDILLDEYPYIWEDIIKGHCMEFGLISIATRNGLLKTLQWLIEKLGSFDRDIADPDASGLIDNAILSGSLAMVKYVTGLGIKRENMIQDHHYGPLLFSSELPSSDIFKFLMSLGIFTIADLQIDDNVILRNAAGEFGSLERFKLVMSYGLDSRDIFPNHEQSEKIQVIRTAYVFERVDILKYINNRYIITLQNLIPSMGFVRAYALYELMQTLIIKGSNEESLMRMDDS